MTLAYCSNCYFILCEKKERVSAHYLTTHAGYPYAYENVISMQTLENVIFVVYFSTVNLVEQRHEHEYIKYYCEMKAGIFKLGIIVVFHYVIHAHPIFDLKNVLKQN